MTLEKELTVGKKIDKKRNEEKRVNDEKDFFWLLKNGFKARKKENGKDGIKKET